MADKKGKSPKQGNRHEKDEKKTPESSSQRTNISDVFLDELKGAFSNFNKIPEAHRIQLYGNQKYLEQFREYFKKEHPNVLDKIDKKDLPIYIHTIEKQYFSLGHIIDTTGKLHEEFKAEDTETHVMQQSLSALRTFCDTKINNIPDGTFRKFADAAGFTHDSLIISSDGELKILDDLPRVWKKFLEKERIVLGASSLEDAERILTPNYNPTERVVIAVALTKIRKALKGTLRAAFDVQFPLPITIFSSCQDLLNFRTEWTQFLADHASEIDESLAKTLDRVIVTNGDIYNELLTSGRKFDDSKGFSQREQYFRRIFNKLATRQLFEEVQTTQDTIEHYITTIATTFKDFPPPVHDILRIYPFDTTTIGAIDPSFHSDVDALYLQIAEYNSEYAHVSDDQKKELRHKIKIAKQEIEQRKWQAYILLLRSKDAALADVFAHLVSTKFDFSLLSSEQQQVLINVFLKHSLEDSIKNKVPELLDVQEEALTTFITDLFDLKKMDLTIPTKSGPVPLSFVKKEFFASAHKDLVGLDDLEDIKNLPLNFLAQLTESNAAFFEESPIFDSIYTDFVAKNGSFHCNDSYKVKLIKDGKPVEGYLSAYGPIDEEGTAEYTGKELYLYSEPVTAPNQERTLVTRPNAEGKASSIPVIIKGDEQSLYDMEILDRKLNLNGDAFGALFFGYVLGQQSMHTTMSAEKEKELAGKFGSLNVYKDKAPGEEEEGESLSPDVPQKNKETVEDTFKNERKQLKGYAFPEDQYKDNAGFVVGSRLFIPFSSSEVPPLETGDAWLQMEITHINTDKGTFTVKIHGGELRLGKTEGETKELSMTPASIASIKKAFGDKIYKVPNIFNVGFNEQMKLLKDGSVVSGLDKHFGSLTFAGGKFSYSLGNYIGKEITHFGLYQPKALDESVNEESGKLILYKIKSNPNGTINVSGDPVSRNHAKNFPARDMDYTTFMLFIKEKGLQPKCKEQVQEVTAQIKADKEETPTTVRGFSINNIFSFFKNGISKIQDGIKKYDDERTEELTDLLTDQGNLWRHIGGFLSPFGRIASSFETMGMEYFQERDNRIWKKVEKRTKFYEDFDYTKLYTMLIEPMLSGKVTIVPHYKIAAILLVHLKKGKGPYAKDPASSAKGNRVGVLLGKDHQARYLAIREKRIRDLEENAHVYGGAWADQIKNELVELEMRYIVHVMDGRQMGINDDNDKTKYYFQGKYSQKFVSELETSYTGFYKQDGVEEGFSKNKDVNFEFASVEYFRQLADRPQQALPFLKVMATKAINDTQWQVFESAVLAGILSGVFLNMTYSSTQSYIQKICRARGFVPGLFAKDIKQQGKMQKILDLFSNDQFSKKTEYNPANFSFRNNIGAKGFISAFKERTDGSIEITSTSPDGQKHKRTGTVRTELSKFLELTGGNVDGKNLVALHADKDTLDSDKALLGDYIDKSNEKNESPDKDVMENTSSLTGSILTKSQSVVEKMIKINETGFAGSNGDDIQNMQEFSKKMQEAVPGKLSSPEEIKFFLGKFMNRFGEKFSGNKKTEFLKRLKRCNAPENAGSGDAKEILYASIVGEIILSLSSSRETFAPPELVGALEAWKDFFKENLSIILSDDVLSDVFGAQSKIELDKYTPTLEPWENAAVLLDREEYNLYIQGLPKDLQAQARAKKTNLSRTGTNYINAELYSLAENLNRRCHQFPNNFKKLAVDQKNKLVSSGPKSTGARIKHSKEVMENVRRILEKKPPQDGSIDLPTYIPPLDDEDPFDV